MIISDSLIDSCKRGKRKSQKELFELLLPYLRNVCYRYLNHKDETDDAVQESFIKIFQKISQFDLSKGAFKSWSCKIAINTSLESNRKTNSIPVSNDNYPKHISIPAEALESLSSEHIMAVVDQLSPDNKTVFMMYCIDGYDHEEIAGLLGIDSTNSRKRLSRAREQLQSIINAQETKQSNSSVA
jgi:RNA polymerase sigma factor (sigma-70 family)